MDRQLVIKSKLMNEWNVVGRYVINWLDIKWLDIPSMI